jgi:hypothetical protein
MLNIYAMIFNLCRLNIRISIFALETTCFFDFIKLVHLVVQLYSGR